MKASEVNERVRNMQSTLLEYLEQEVEVITSSAGNFKEAERILKILDERFPDQREELPTKEDKSTVPRDQFEWDG